MYILVFYVCMVDGLIHIEKDRYCLLTEPFGSQVYQPSAVDEEEHPHFVVYFGWLDFFIQISIGIHADHLMFDVLVLQKFLLQGICTERILTVHKESTSKAVKSNADTSAMLTSSMIVL